MARRPAPSVNRPRRLAIKCPEIPCLSIRAGWPPGISGQSHESPRDSANHGQGMSNVSPVATDACGSADWPHEMRSASLSLRQTRSGRSATFSETKTSPASDASNTRISRHILKLPGAGRTSLLDRTEPFPGKPEYPCPGVLAAQNALMHHPGRSLRFGAAFAGKFSACGSIVPFGKV